MNSKTCKQYFFKIYVTTFFQLEIPLIFKVFFFFEKIFKVKITLNFFLINNDFLRHNLLSIIYFWIL